MISQTNVYDAYFSFTFSHFTYAYLVSLILVKDLLNFLNVFFL